MSRLNPSDYGGLEVDPRNNENTGLEVDPEYSNLETVDRSQRDNKESVPPKPPSYAALGPKEDPWNADAVGILHSREPSPSAYSGLLPVNQAQPPIRSRKKLWIIIGIIAAIIVVVAIAVPVGITSSKPSSNDDGRNNDPENTISSSSSSDTRTPSLKGAFNGTGLAAIAPLFGDDAYWLFCQDHTGKVRLQAMDQSGNWKEGQDLGITDAVDGTALAALTHYNSSNIPINHLIYITTDLYLSDRIQSLGRGPWVPGGLRAKDLRVAARPSLSAPQHLSYWPAHTDFAYLYAPNEDGFMTQIRYDKEHGVWTLDHVFENTNGFGGSGVQVYGWRQELKQVQMVGAGDGDDGGQLVMYWQNSNSSETWVRGATAEASLAANSSLANPGGGAQELVYYLDERGTVTAQTMSGEEGDAEWVDERKLNVEAMSGSALFATLYAIPGSERVETQLFFQRHGDDIQHYSGDKYSFEYIASLKLDD